MYRERERERCMYIYIYIYMYTYVWRSLPVARARQSCLAQGCVSNDGRLLAILI